MKLVLDASVAVKWVLPEPDSSLAVRMANVFSRKWGNPEALCTAW